jgi:hypothetical protein
VGVGFGGVVGGREGEGTEELRMLDGRKVS